MSIHHDPDSKIGNAHARYVRPVVGFSEMTPAQHIEAATELMREVTSAQAWTPETLRTVTQAYRELLDHWRRLGH
jgi:hypothetical protein